MRHVGWKYHNPESPWVEQCSEGSYLEACRSQLWADYTEYQRHRRAAVPNPIPIVEPKRSTKPRHTFPESDPYLVGAILPLPRTGWVQFFTFTGFIVRNIRFPLNWMEPWVSSNSITTHGQLLYLMEIVEAKVLAADAQKVSSPSGGDGSAKSSASSGDGKASASGSSSSDAKLDAVIGVLGCTKPQAMEYVRRVFTPWKGTDCDSHIMM